MKNITEDSAFPSPIYRFWQAHLEAAMDRLADSIAAGQTPSFKDQEIIRVLYARLKGRQP